MAGMWNFDGRPVDREFLGRLGDSIDQYGPDGGSEYISRNFAMIHRAFNINKESRLEHQPYVTYHNQSRSDGPRDVRNVMTWDGRLDNRKDLIRALSYELETGHRRNDGVGYTDVAIVMAAWEAWGTECFKKLIGDYSLAVWEPNSRTLTLAKDFIGVRYLYYEILPEGTRGGARSDPQLGDAEPPSGPCVWWCSRLEPLILLSGRHYELNEEYIAGYFAFHPASHLTPYIGVDALLAGHYAQIHNGRKKLVQYWNFGPDKRIRYKNDAEYEEHFRHVFFQSVKRRLRADSPVVAGLSGGRDSSAIVCVADELIAKGEAEAPRLDTYSRYDEEEPFGNDKPYLTIIEQKRGRTGHHFGQDKIVIPNAAEGSASLRHLRPLDLDCFSAHPGISQGTAEAIQERMKFMKLNKYRIILSGIGGDEVTGGVPYCISELADLFAQGRFIRLASQLKAWALAKNRTWGDLVWNTAKSLQPAWTRKTFWTHKCVWPWIDPGLVERQRETFIQSPLARAPRQGLPSFRTNVAVLVGVSSQLAHVAKLHRRGAKDNCYDRGFPFLDRDFLEFMLAIPREQVLRPGQYRSLMRRALTGIVPQEILNRTRKAFAARKPALGIQLIGTEIRHLFTQPLGGFGYVNPVQFRNAVDDILAGKTNLIGPIQQTISLQMWLGNLVERRTLQGTSDASAAVPEARLQGVA